MYAVRTYLLILTVPNHSLLNTYVKTLTIEHCHHTHNHIINFYCLTHRPNSCHFHFVTNHWLLIVLTAVAIVVLTQGILVTLLLIDQILNTYTDYSVYGALKKYYHHRVTLRKKGCE
jgi:hypothetical protein